MMIKSKWLVTVFMIVTLVGVFYFRQQKDHPGYGVKVQSFSNIVSEYNKSFSSAKAESLKNRIRQNDETILADLRTRKIEISEFLKTVNYILDTEGKKDFFCGTVFNDYAIELVTGGDEPIYVKRLVLLVAQKRGCKLSEFANDLVAKYPSISSPQVRHIVQEFLLLSSSVPKITRKYFLGKLEDNLVENVDWILSIPKMQDVTFKGELLDRIALSLKNGKTKYTTEFVERVVDIVMASDLDVGLRERLIRNILNKYPTINMDELVNRNSVVLSKEEVVKLRNMSTQAASHGGAK